MRTVVIESINLITSPCADALARYTVERERATLHIYGTTTDSVHAIGRAEVSTTLSVQFVKFSLYFLLILFIYVFIGYIFQAVHHARAVNAQHTNIGSAG